MSRRILLFVLLISLIFANTGCQQILNLPNTQKEPADQAQKQYLPIQQSNPQVETTATQKPTVLAPTLLPTSTPTEAPETYLASTPESGTNTPRHWQIVSQKLQKSEDAEHYFLQIQYPNLSGNTDPFMDEFSRAIQNWLSAETDYFINLAQNAPVTTGDGFLYANYIVTTQQGWSPKNLIVDYQKSQPALSANQAVFNGGVPVLSILFQLSEYSGGAHPGDAHDTINFSLNSGDLINLSDLFLPGTDYLTAISNICIANLGQNPNLNYQEVVQGASPQAENYRVWAITPNGLLVIFDEYQVGPYAAGPQSVVIPFAALKDILDPFGPLGNYSTAKP